MDKNLVSRIVQACNAQKREWATDIRDQEYNQGIDDAIVAVRSILETMDNELSIGEAIDDQMRDSA